MQCRREIAILLDEHGIRVRLDDEPAVSRFVERMRSGESVLWPGRLAQIEKAFPMRAPPLRGLCFSR